MLKCSPRALQYSPKVCIRIQGFAATQLRFGLGFGAFLQAPDSRRCALAFSFLGFGGFGVLAAPAPGKAGQALRCRAGGAADLL